MQGQTKVNEAGQTLQPLFPTEKLNLPGFFPVEKKTETRTVPTIYVSKEVALSLNRACKIVKHIAALEFTSLDSDEERPINISVFGGVPVILWRDPGENAIKILPRADTKKAKKKPV
jgi:hypothetical protein